MPEPIITPLEPEDSALRHPKVEPDSTLRQELKPISGNTKPDWANYGSSDYWNMAKAIILDWISGKVNGGGISFSTVYYTIIILIIAVMMLFILTRVGVL